VVRRLLEDDRVKRAINIPNKDGWTALYTVLSTFPKEETLVDDLVRLLLEAGADPSLGLPGGSPLDLARSHGYYNAVMLLEVGRRGSTEFALFFGIY